MYGLITLICSDQQSFLHNCQIIKGYEYDIGLDIRTPMLERVPDIRQNPNTEYDVRLNI